MTSFLVTKLLYICCGIAFNHHLCSQPNSGKSFKLWSYDQPPSVSLDFLSCSRNKSVVHSKERSVYLCFQSNSNIQCKCPWTCLSTRGSVCPSTTNGPAHGWFQTLLPRHWTLDCFNRSASVTNVVLSCISTNTLTNREMPVIYNVSWHAELLLLCLCFL